MYKLLVLPILARVGFCNILGGSIPIDCEAGVEVAFAATDASKPFGEDFPISGNGLQPLLKHVLCTGNNKGLLKTLTYEGHDALANALTSGIHKVVPSLSGEQKSELKKNLDSLLNFKPGAVSTSEKAANLVGVFVLLAKNNPSHLVSEKTKEAIIKSLSKIKEDLSNDDIYTCQENAKLAKHTSSIMIPFLKSALAQYKNPVLATTVQIFVQKSGIILAKRVISAFGFECICENDEDCENPQKCEIVGEAKHCIDPQPQADLAKQTEEITNAQKKIKELEERLEAANQKAKRAANQTTPATTTTTANQTTSAVTTPPLVTQIAGGARLI